MKMEDRGRDKIGSGNSEIVKGLMEDASCLN